MITKFSSNGNHISPKETISNLKKICDALVKEGKIVWLATIPTGASKKNANRTKSESESNDQLRNEFIVEYLERFFDFPLFPLPSLLLRTNFFFLFSFHS